MEQFTLYQEYTQTTLKEHEAAIMHEWNVAEASDQI